VVAAINKAKVEGWKKLGVDIAGVELFKKIHAGATVGIWFVSRLRGC